MSLHIVQAGPLTTLQDLGRTGYLRYGINQAGVMDTVAATAVWRLLGHTPGETPVIEIPLGGLSVSVDTPTTVAVVSPGFRISLDGDACGASARVTLQPGQVLDIKPGTTGRFAYFGAHADWAVAPVLGAYATHLRSGVGPHGTLAAGDRFEQQPRPLLAERPALPPFDHGTLALRAVPGPQLDYFPDHAVSRFYSQAWAVGPASDRMATSLVGDALAHRGSHDILSDGIAFGAVQVPGSGQPFVLMADRGTTGGYPKIATVISVDLPRVAQARPGDTLRFVQCTLDEAAQLRAAQAEALEDWLRTPGAPDGTRLFSENLISGVVSATRTP
ncbi:MAG: biotin-dependent carboxyltransferase family protein [Pseudomonadota bacterium]